MNYSNLIPVVLLLIVLGTGCGKKENAKPVVKSTTTIDSVQLSAAAKLYPRTDTFTGVMAVSMLEYATAGFDSTNNHFTFYVTYLDEHTVIYSSGGSIWLQQGSTTSVNDTCTVNTARTDSGNMYVYDWEKKGNDVYPNSIVFKLDQKNLSVSWDIADMPLIGACDWSENVGQFTGILSHN